MNEWVEALDASLNQVLFGQRQVVRSILVAVLARGHVMLEGVPGVGKTLAARALSARLGLNHKRIQFTPDLMPNDVVGSTIFRSQTAQFEFIKGPVFTDVLIADELNRTPPKTQAALLEAMEERQATVDGVTHALSEFFCVVATQNPLELEGTYPLPEAQLDRFLMRIRCSYPSEADEVAMIQGHGRGALSHQPLVTREQLRQLQQRAADLTVDATLFRYITAIVRATRDQPGIRLGASPRASLALLSAAKAHAVFSKRDYATPDDVKSVATQVLAHRLSLKAEAEMEGLTADSAIAATLSNTPIVR